MSRLSKIVFKTPEVVVDVDDDMSAYYILKQKLDVIFATGGELRPASAMVSNCSDYGGIVKRHVIFEHSATYWQRCLVTINDEEVLFWKARLDGERQVNVPETHRKVILYSIHYPILAEHPATRWMYN